MNSLKKFLLVLICFGFVSTLQAENDEASTIGDSLEYLIGRSDFGQAVNYLLRNKPKEDEDKLIAFDWFFNYSKASLYNAQTDVAFKSVQKALELSTELNDSLNFKAIVQLIEVYRATGSHDKALKVIRSIEKDGIAFNGPLKCRFYHRAAAVYNEWHYMESDLNCLDTAIEYSEKSLEISRRLKLEHFKALSYNELGAIYETKKMFNESIQFFDSAQVIWKKISLVNYLNVVKNKSNYFLSVLEFDSALTYANNALDLLGEKPFYRLKSELFWILKKVFYLNNDSLEGARAELQANKYNILYMERKMDDRLENLTILYDTKQKDLEIQKNRAIIKKEEEQLQITAFIIIILISFIAFIIYTTFVTKRKNRELNNLLKENEFLVGEANHRIKNNLQLIISLIGREVYKKDNQNSGGNFLTNVVEKINAIATLHQQLYLNKSKKEISVEKYIQNIGDNFDGLFQDQTIELTLEIEDFSMNIDQAVYLGLLTTELFTNSIKHAFVEREKNKVSLTLKKEGKNKVLLIYKDNGVGLKENQEPALVNLLIKQLKAESHHSSSIGYQLKIYFKI